MRFATFCTALGLALAATTVAANAESVRLLGDFRDWSSYASADSSTGAVCFSLTKPKTVEPQPDGYTQAHLYITHRPAENIKNEFNLVAGFAFQPDSTATITVGGQSFTLFTQNDTAWLDDANQSDNLASAIRAGSSMVVEGTTAGGIKVVENFSLSGATAAAKAINDECK
ncbi:invasion associated locus B family protein [Devosia sp.]|uniref:invasion associated locus B family protein n=1 Tax=Devosia sp. TaxID=1871048 RepID=UPI00326688DB